MLSTEQCRPGTSDYNVVNALPKSLISEDTSRNQEKLKGLKGSLKFIAIEILT